MRKANLRENGSAPVKPATIRDKRSVVSLRHVRLFVTVALLLFASISFYKSQYLNQILRAIDMDPQKIVGVATESASGSPEQTRIDPDIVAKKFWKEHQFETERCLRKDHQALSNAINDLILVFDQKQENVPEFLDDLFSFKSKGKMAYYFVRGGERLENFLQHKSEQYFGSGYMLQNEVERITGVLKMEIQRNHNELMLVLESDLAALPYNLNIRHRSGEDFINDFNASFDTALKGMLPRTVGVQLGAETVGLAVDIWLASVIGARIVNVMVTTGILAGGSTAAGGTAIAAGASLGPWTAGASIAVGIVVAVVIDWACNKVARADAEEKIMAALDSWKDTSIASFSARASEGINKFNDARLTALQKAFKKELSLQAQTIGKK
jgi:hypothetical protein